MLTMAMLEEENARLKRRVRELLDEVAQLKGELRMQKLESRLGEARKHLARAGRRDLEVVVADTGKLSVQRRR